MKMKSIIKNKYRLFIFLLIIACELFTGCSKKVEVVTPYGETTIIETEKGTSIIDPFEYYDVVFSGYNGYGTASIEPNINNTNTFFSFDIDKSNNLSNGDTICITVDTGDIYNGSTTIISPAYQEFEVQGLKELTEINPFENLEIQFDGISPYITVSYNTSACPDIISENVNFQTDSQYLKSGETFEVIAELKSDKDSLGIEGYKISESTKSYTVENVSKFITNVSDADLTELKDEISDYIEANSSKSVGTDRLFGLTANWQSIKEIDDISLYSSYMFYLKSRTTPENDDIYNKYCDIYCITYTVNADYYYPEESLKAYVAVFADNISVDTNENVLYNFGKEFNPSMLYFYSDFSIYDLEANHIISEKSFYNVAEAE